MQIYQNILYFFLIIVFQTIIFFIIHSIQNNYFQQILTLLSLMIVLIACRVGFVLRQPIVLFIPIHLFLNNLLIIFSNSSIIFLFIYINISLTVFYFSIQIIVWLVKLYNRFSL